MIKGKLVGFEPTKIASSMIERAVEEQTRRLVEYANAEIQKIGNKINSYNGAHHMDRTGNLLNSLCWGVTYKGKMMESGFYREAVTHTYTNRWGEERGLGVSGGSASFLHEFNNPTGEEVNGRQLAQNFLNSYKGKESGWTVFFAVLAPYWGYWEQGFTMRSGGGTVYKGESRERKILRSSRFMRFQVMLQVVDEVRVALKPAKTNIEVHVETYSYNARSRMGKKYKKQVIHQET